MFETDTALRPLEVDDLEDWMLLELLEEETQARAQSDRRLLRFAERFILNTRVELGSGQAYAGWDDEGLVEVEVEGFVDTLGGEGTPLIGVEAPVQWSLASDRSLASAQHYLANTMDLTYRFPKLRVKVEALELSVWVAFRVCEDTRHLSYECARWIDDQIAARNLYGQRTLDFIIKSGIARFHPDLVKNTGALDRDDWDVTVDHNPNHTPGGGNGTSKLEAVGDSVDLKKFLDAVNDEAATAGRLGDTDTLAQRKAKALGTLADRQATLDYAGCLDIPHTNGTPATGNATAGADGTAGASSGTSSHDGGTDTDDGTPAARSGDGGRDGDANADGSVDGDGSRDGTAHADGSPAGGGRSRGSGFRPTVNAHGDLVHPQTGKTVTRRRSYGKTRLYVHLTAEDLAAFADGDLAAMGDAGTLGPQTIEKITQWLRGFGPDAKITPVIDLAKQWAVDQHDPPPEMREQVILRDQHCVFPNCKVDARLCDMEHIEAYDEHGPPGQTSPEGLAPVCRRHHLVKTHDGWCYRRNKDGTYLWTSPQGRKWLVTPEGTIDIP